MVSGESLENRVAVQPADSMSKYLAMREELLLRLAPYTPNPGDPIKLHRGMQLPMILGVPLDAIDEHLKEKSTHYEAEAGQVLCGIPLLLQGIVPNGHWHAWTGALEQTLAKYNLRTGSLGCYDGRAWIDTAANVLKVSVRLTMGTIPPKHIRDIAVHMPVQGEDNHYFESRAYHQFGGN